VTERLPTVVKPGAYSLSEESILAVLQTLTPEEEDLVYLYFVKKRTQGYIAKLLNASPRTIGRRLIRVQTKIKQGLSSGVLAAQR
jgi:DNA-directed RNA polymerase specialized sigma24 family protein